MLCMSRLACGSREGTCGAGFDERTRWAWTSYSGSGGASWWWTLHVACIMSVLRRAGCCTSQCESGFVLGSETHNQNSLRQTAKQEAHPPWRLDLNDRARFGHEPHDDLTHFPYTRAQLRIHAHVHAHPVNSALATQAQRRLRGCAPCLGSPMTCNGALSIGTMPS